METDVKVQHKNCDYPPQKVPAYPAQATTKKEQWGAEWNICRKWQTNGYIMYKAILHTITHACMIKQKYSNYI